MSPTLPQFIAMCGQPLSGKSTAAAILGELYDYHLVDDGHFLRQIAIDHFGATHDDVYTQQGKLRTTIVNGEEMTWRDVLGRIGEGFEDQFGANVIPELAYNGLTSDRRYVFGSVRREQGLYHKSRGALILEIDNPDAAPSPYAFDAYNRDHVDATVRNDSLTLGFDDYEARERFKSQIKVALGRLAPEAA